MKIVAIDKDIFSEVSGIAGSVHSVFKSTVSLCINERLLTIVPSTAGKGPGFIITEDEEDFRASGFKPGMPVLINASLNRFQMGESIYFINEAELFSSVADLDDIGIDFKKLKANVSYIRKNLSSLMSQEQCSFDKSLISIIPDITHPQSQQKADSSCVLPVWVKYIAETLETLKQSIIIQDEDLFSMSLKKLVGAGWGLTPGGDDFITGMLCFTDNIYHSGKRVNRKEMAAPGFIRKSVKKHLPDFLGRTGFISSSYLQYALERRYTQSLVDFCRVFTGANLTEDQKTLTKLLSRGATSGADTIAGILFTSDIFVTADE